MFRLESQEGLCLSLARVCFPSVPITALVSFFFLLFVAHVFGSWAETERCEQAVTVLTYLHGVKEAQVKVMKVDKHKQAKKWECCEPYAL